MSIQKTNEGIGVAGLLGVVFVTLKLCHVIDWSWWWVTLPFWAGAAVAIAVIMTALLVAFIAWICD